MIIFTEGDLLSSNSHALVNPVNTVGFMGKGLAKQFKKRFPKNFREYSKACADKKLKVGKMFVCEENGRIIINFPTKAHYRQLSELKWIKDGLEDLVKIIHEHKINSIAIPALGCGLGGLSWPIVRQLIIGTLGNLTYIDITIYEPKGL